MWLLADEGRYGVDGEEVPLALRVDIDGLFVDPQPAPAPARCGTSFPQHHRDLPETPSSGSSTAEPPRKEHDQ